MLYLTSLISQLRESTGQTMTETAFILALIVLVVVVVVPLFGSETTKLYDSVVTGFGG
jgi:Flp pilus assembly pilin Flp